VPRRFPLLQFPNRSLIATFAAAMLARTTKGTTARVAAAFSQLALLLWAGQELVAGVNWFRRLVGVSGVAYGVNGLKRPISQLLARADRRPR